MMFLFLKPSNGFPLILGQNANILRLHTSHMVLPAPPNFPIVPPPSPPCAPVGFLYSSNELCSLPPHVFCICHSLGLEYSSSQLPPTHNLDINSNDTS